MRRTHRAVAAAPSRRLLVLRAENVGRVLFPALMMEGAGKQNAVVVIEVRRYAGRVLPRPALCWTAFCLWPDRIAGGVKDKPGLSNLEDDEMFRPYRSWSEEIDWLRGRLV